MGVQNFKNKGNALKWVAILQLPLQILRALANYHKLKYVEMLNLIKRLLLI